MLEINLFGCGGMLPLPNRFLTACAVRHNGKTVLIDCGEGTQIAARIAGIGFKQIAAICLTHFHADHVAGLPGLLLTIGNSGREEPLIIAGPRYVGQVVDCLRVIAPELPYPVEYVEVEVGSPLELAGLRVAVHPVPHRIPCYAYRFDLERQGRFDVERATALGIPVQLWSQLQSGREVAHEGAVFRPEQVLGRPRKGLRVSYATDLRPVETLSDFVRGSDLFICEGMYGDPGDREKAAQKHHCMFDEAADMAKRAEAGELWLTHFSPALQEPEAYLRHATAIFPQTYLGPRSKRLVFPE